MKLSELFEALDSKVEYEVVKQTAHTYSTRAKIAGRWVKVIFDTDDQVTWNFEFRETKEGETKSTSALTGSGGQFKVLSMVDDVLAEFISIYNPLHIEFTAHLDSKSRANVFERMFKKTKGYRLKRTDNEKTTSFILTRK